MQIRPEKWSHHHAHRLFHISMGVCFAFVAVVLAIGMVAIWLQAQADGSPKVELIQLTAMVGGVNPGPISSGGSVTPPPTNQIPTITIYAEPRGQVPQKLVQFGQTTVMAYAFTVARPAFSGESSVPNSLIFLTIQGPQNLNSTALANGQGGWFWQSPQVLPKGTYLITATVYNPNDLSKYSSAQAYFTIESQPGQDIPGSPGIVTPPGPAAGSSGSGGELLFGIFFEVLKDYKKVMVGDKVVGSITLVSNSGKEVENQVIEYQVIGIDGEVIMESSDTVSFSKIAKFLKVILTAPGTQPGLYTVIVKSTYQGFTSIASDTFVLEPAVPGAAEPGTGPIILWSALTGLLLLFLLLVLVAYYQVRLVSRHIKEHNERWHK